MAKYVWRVENEHGLGPYEDDRLVKMVIKHSNNFKKWPTPHIEEINVQNKICGFKNKEDAYKWFKGYWNLLHKYGYKLKRIRAVRVAYGKKQVTFQRARS